MPWVRDASLLISLHQMANRTFDLTVHMQEHCTDCSTFRLHRLVSISYRREVIGISRNRGLRTMVFSTILAFVRSVAVHSMNTFLVFSVMAE